MALSLPRSHGKGCDFYSLRLNPHHESAKRLNSEAEHVCVCRLVLSAGRSFLVHLICPRCIQYYTMMQPMRSPPQLTHRPSRFRLASSTINPSLDSSSRQPRPNSLDTTTRKRPSRHLARPKTLASLPGLTPNCPAALRSLTGDRGLFRSTNTAGSRKNSCSSRAVWQCFNKQL